MKLKLASTVVVFLLLQTLSVLGQTRELSPSETTKVVEVAYEILGPQRGCVLYEDAAVLTLANRQLKYRRYNELFKEDEEVTRQLNEMGEKVGLRFLLEDSYLSIASVPATRAYVSTEEADWLQPLQEEDDPLDWSYEVISQLPEGFEQVPASFSDLLEMGAPTSILSSGPEVAKYVQEGRELMEVWLFKPMRFTNGKFWFYTLPKHAKSEQLKNWLSKRQDFLGEFYSISSVRKRITKDKSFLAARAGLDESVSLGLQNETWWTSKELENLKGLSYTHVGSTPTFWQERLLNEHYKEWASLVDSGAHPSKWLESFNRWSFEQGTDTPLNMDILEAWMWLGAYEQTPERAAIYQSATNTFPEFYEYQVKTKLQEWTESEYSKYQFYTNVPLFGHPEVKSYFNLLPEDEKRPFREEFKIAITKDERHREIFLSPPYSAEVSLPELSEQLKSNKE